MPTSRHRTSLVAAATAIAAVSALALTACDSSSPSASSSPSSSVSPSSSASSGGSGVSTSGSPTSDQSTGSAPVVGAAHTTAPTTSSPSTAPAGPPRCHTADLAASFAMGGDAVPDVTTDEQQTTDIALTNTSGHACVIGGYPGLDLSGGKTTWPLPRQSAPRRGAITLAPKDTTDFTITFMPDPKGPWTPTTVVLTPPNETTSKVLTWPWGPVLLQDGATHPGSYVGLIG